MANPPPAQSQVFELSLYRRSPLGPVVTTIVIGVIVFGLFLVNVWAVEDFAAFVADPQGQSTLRAAFLLTLILCAALGVNIFDDRAYQIDAAVLREDFGLALPARRQNSRGLLWASIAGAVVGLGFLAFIIWSNTGADIRAFATSLGLWFMPMTPLLWVLLARGAFGSFVAGRSMTKFIENDLTIDLYRHHELSVFGRIAMRGAFIWLIFVGIVLLGFADGGGALFAQVTMYITIIVAIFNFVSTMQPIRQKIRAAKRAELKLIRERLAKARLELGIGAAGADIPALIALEDHIEKVREWPLDLPTAARLPLYILVLVVPWAIGVYAETIVQGFLGGG